MVMLSLRKDPPQSGFDTVAAILSATLYKCIREKHIKTKKKTQQKIDNVYLCVSHFEEKMKRRGKMLLLNIDNSKNNKYKRLNFWWRKRFDEIMAKKRECRKLI